MDDKNRQLHYYKLMFGKFRPAPALPPDLQVNAEDVIKAECDPNRPIGFQPIRWALELKRRESVLRNADYIKQAEELHKQIDEEFEFNPFMSQQAGRTQWKPARRDVTALIEAMRYKMRLNSDLPRTVKYSSKIVTAHQDLTEEQLKELESNGTLDFIKQKQEDFRKRQENVTYTQDIELTPEQKSMLNADTDSIFRNLQDINDDDSEISGVQLKRVVTCKLQQVAIDFLKQKCKEFTGQDQLLPREIEDLEKKACLLVEHNAPDDTVTVFELKGLVTLDRKDKAVHVALHYFNKKFSYVNEEV